MILKEEKLAEQRATKRLKGDGDGKRINLLGKRESQNLTVSRALSDEIEARERSLASVKEQEKKNKKI